MLAEMMTQAVEFERAEEAAAVKRAEEAAAELILQDDREQAALQQKREKAPRKMSRKGQSKAATGVAAGIVLVCHSAVLPDTVKVPVYNCNARGQCVWDSM